MPKSYREKKESTWALSNLKQSIIPYKLWQPDEKDKQEQDINIWYQNIYIYIYIYIYRYTKAEENIAKIHKLYGPKNIQAQMRSQSPTRKQIQI